MKTLNKPSCLTGLLTVIFFCVCFITETGCSGPSPAASAADSTAKMQTQDTVKAMSPAGSTAPEETPEIKKQQTEYYHSLQKKVVKPKLPVGAVEKKAADSQPAATENGMKYGILGYSYPPSIRVGDSKTIHAFISVKFPESKVRDTLIKIVLSDDSRQKGDSIVMVKAIRLYKEVTMTLACMDTVLTVTPIHPSASQLIDTVNGNKWSWDIYAKTADHPRSKLKLTIATTGPASYEEKTLVINIKVESNFVRVTYDYLMDNPKVLVSSILIPVVGFFGGRYFKRRKKRRTGNS